MRNCQDRADPAWGSCPRTDGAAPDHGRNLQCTEPADFTDMFCLKLVVKTEERWTLPFANQLLWKCGSRPQEARGGEGIMFIAHYISESELKEQQDNRRKDRHTEVCRLAMSF